jgi:hypothetical protein
MAGKMMPEQFSFENTWANTKIYKFHMNIAQADGAEATIFYNTSGYTRAFFKLFIQSSHGSIGWAQLSGQISRYGANYVETNDNMAYQNTGYIQNPSAANYNGIKLIRTGTYGTSTCDIYGILYAPSGCGIELFHNLSGTNTLNHSYILSKGV